MKKTILRLVIIAVAMTAFASCRSNTVKIGVIIPETSGLGASLKSGLKLAEDELNRESGTKYELVFSDAPSESEVSKRYDRLRFVNKIRIFVTTGSKYSMKLKAYAVKNGDLLFCVASDPAITAEGYWNVFKIGNSSVDESNYIVDYLEESEDSGKVALFYPNTEYGIPFNGTICSRLENCIPTIYEEGAYQQYDGMISKVLSNNPDKVIAIGFSPSLGILIKKLRASGFGGEIVSNAGFADSDVMAAAGDAASGVLYIDYNFEMTQKTLERNEYTRKNYGIDFTSISFLAYTIPYLIDMGLSGTAGKDGGSLMDEEILNQSSDKIRSGNTTMIGGEYPYDIFANGDVKPSLILRRHE